MSRLVGGVDDPLGGSPIDPDRVRDAACDVTTDASICNPSAPDPPNVDPPAGDAAGAAGLGSLFILLLVLLLVAALLWVFWQWRVARDPSKRRRAADDQETDLDEDEDAELPVRIIDEERPPDRWRRQAAEHRSRGEYRDAVRCEYRALVGDLARAGLVDEIPGRTSGEERSQVAELAGRDARVTTEFSVAADVFDTAWFDDGETTLDDDERFLAAERAVLDSALVGGRRR